MTLKEFFSIAGSPTQTEVARLAEISTSRLSNYANGWRTPPQDVAAMIAKVTGEPSLYTHWYPSLEQQLERLEKTHEQQANR